mmetsp:Transcript_559/g.2591  ORF Transcript_559/g.2591 Transcript_559/m.2591 type:complete len:311 (+) Transcript_559:2018-2950(+)
MRLTPLLSNAWYSRCRYSRSSTVRWMIVSGWLMVAGSEILVRSFPMACRRMEKSEKLRFTGCGAGRRALGVHGASSSSFSDSDDASSFSSSSSSSSFPSDPIESSEWYASPEMSVPGLGSSVPPLGSSPIAVTAKSCRLTTSMAWRYLLVSKSCVNVDVCADANDATEPYSLPRSSDSDPSSDPSSLSSSDSAPTSRLMIFFASLSSMASLWSIDARLRFSRTFSTSSSAHRSRSSSRDKPLSFRLASAAASTSTPTPLPPREGTFVSEASFPEERDSNRSRRSRTTSTAEVYCSADRFKHAVHAALADL